MKDFPRAGTLDTRDSKFVEVEVEVVPAEAIIYIVIRCENAKFTNGNINSNW